MTMDHSDDPLRGLLRAPGTIQRAAALALSAVALILPGLTSISEDISASFMLPDMMEWVFLVPVLIGTALLTPAIAPLARYAAIFDLVALAGGAVAVVTLFLKYGDLAKQIDMGRQMLQRYNEDGIWSASVGIGGWLLIAAAVIIATRFIPGLGRRAHSSEAAR